MDLKHSISVAVASIKVILLLSNTKTIQTKIWAATIGFFSLNAISKEKNNKNKSPNFLSKIQKENLQREGFSLNWTTKENTQSTRVKPYLHKPRKESQILKPKKKKKTSLTRNPPEQYGTSKKKTSQ
jgi:hypothetical protein